MHPASMLTSMRPLLKRVLPKTLHDGAGRAGRRFIRAVDRWTIADQRPDWHRLAPKPEPAPENGPVVMVSASLQAGGAERQLVNLVRALALRNAAPHALICFRLSESLSQSFFVSELAGAPVEIGNALPFAEAHDRLMSIYGQEQTGKVVALLSWAPSDLREQILRLAAEFASRRPAIVHGWQDETGLAAAVAASVVGVPRILVATRNLNPSRFEYYRAYMQPLYARLAGEPSITFTNNSMAGARDYEHWLGLPEGRFEVLRNGVEPGALAPADEVAVQKRRRDLGIPDSAPVIGGMFRLQAEKRPLLWVRAAYHLLQSVPEAWFVIYGGGTLEKKVRSLARQLGIGERMIIEGNTASAAGALSCFDALLLTSIQEGTPNVVLEASALGIPVVATAVGGTPETIIPGVTGLLIASPPGIDEDQLARDLAIALTEALRNVSLRRSAREQGPLLVSRSFSMDSLIESAEALHAGRPMAL